MLWASCVVAQVLPPAEIKAPALRALQQKHEKELQAISTELKKHQFPYPFYFSRKLDIDEPEQKQSDQRSIRFDFYNQRRALVITGNYFAAYSDARVDADHRMRETYLAVVLPILQIVVPMPRSITMAKRRCFGSTEKDRSCRTGRHPPPCSPACVPL